MLKSLSKDEIFYNSKPRKLVKINVQQDQNYNEYKGQFIEIETRNLHQPNHHALQNQNDELKFKNFEEEKKRNVNIFVEVKKGQNKVKKISDILIKKQAKKEQTSQNKTQIKIKQEKIIQQQGSNRQNNTKLQIKNKPDINGLSNWQKFKNNNKNTNQLSNLKKKSYEFASLDCEFVKHNQQQLLARISIVSQDGSCLLDSYVHPDKLITDYVKDISGITYAHIKNAPKMNQVIEKVKRILLNKTIIGHTIWKDMQVCGLKNWKGYKYIIDIAEYNDFKQKNGKLISLKNLSLKHLSKKIQDGTHSSVQDAEAAMNLFRLRKKEILKQFKIIL